jgi:RNA polymerase sigma-70 factor (ECF subfamily)
VVISIPILVVRIFDCQIAAIRAPNRGTMSSDDDAMRTRASLLVRLRDAGDDSAWRQFVEIYTPLIHGFCRQRDLQEADAADVCQEVMRTVARGAGHFEYDPSRGRFRNWLLTVVRSKLSNFLASRQRQPDPAGPSVLM